jgi:Cu(I)/Ag(I) efflux system membrane protein CusA/SilA
MTVAAILMGLLPIMWSTGAGADVMKRIAAPMVGGVITAAVLALVIYPVIFALWKWHFEVKPALAGRQD